MLGFTLVSPTLASFPKETLLSQRFLWPKAGKLRLKWTFTVLVCISTAKSKSGNALRCIRSIFKNIIPVLKHIINYSSSPCRLRVLATSRFRKGESTKPDLDISLPLSSRAGRRILMWLLNKWSCQVTLPEGMDYRLSQWRGPEV